MPQLDSLRAFAFFGVAASHWLVGQYDWATVGGPGVQLFYVLSGFLITGILLDYRKAHESDPSIGAGFALRTFYARRSLRIFPLFYAVIAVTLLLNIGPIRELWPWHAGYASNFLYGITRATPGDPFTHFWSLAVEEQFYLVWPFLVFFVPLRRLKTLILAMIAFAPIFRAAMEYALPELHRVNYFPPSCGDSLGLGAFLAYASRFENRFTPPATVVARRFGLGGAAVGVALTALVPLIGTPYLLLTIGHTCAVFIFGWIVFGAAQGFSGFAGTVLNRPELRFLGQISYGLYVFHHFFTFIDFAPVLQQIGFSTRWSHDAIAQAFVRFALTTLLAAVSWYTYERPFNGLKRHFTLRKSRGHQPVMPSLNAGERSALGTGS